MTKEIVINKNHPLKYAGIILIATTLISLFMMMHHPTVAAKNTSAQVAEILQETLINNAVHGSLMLMVIVTLIVYLLYSYHRGFDKVTIIIAQLFFGIGTMAMIGAALINGFIYPDFVQGFSSATADDLDQISAIKALLWSCNQSLAKMAVIFMSIAMIFWSYELFNKQNINRIIAILGIAAGLYCGLAILLAFIELNLSGMTRIVAIQGIWHFAMAYIMIKKPYEQ